MFKYDWDFHIKSHEQNGTIVRDGLCKKCRNKLNRDNKYSEDPKYAEHPFETCTDCGEEKYIRHFRVADIQNHTKIRKDVCASCEEAYSDQYKTCKHCNETKHITNFAPHSYRADGTPRYKAQCSECRAKDRKASRQKKKVCISCNQYRPLDYFVITLRRENGQHDYGTKCRVCRDSEYQKNQQQSAPVAQAK
jgi:hypothetical protein